MGKRGGTLRDQWTSLFADYKKKYPDLADALDQHGAPATSRWAGTKICPTSLPMRKA